ncbi:rod-binding protein [Vibrio sp.]|uniref:rod-binding protein n=1 Tax=Vibrio sp. TaxID=678 RepID=UPI0037A50C1F
MSVTIMPVNPMALQAMPIATSPIAQNTAGGVSGNVTAFDSRNLNDLKLADEKQALEGVAEQFESMFLQMVLKQMRQASEALNSDEDNPLLSSRELKTYQEFFDGQISIEMAKGRLGLAESIVEQLSRTQAELNSDFAASAFKESEQTVALYSQQQQKQSVANLQNNTSQTTRAFHQSLLLVNEKESTV